MKTAILGAGAIGSVVAAKLVQAGAGDVLLVGRQDHVAAIEKDGLKVVSAEGEDIVQVPVATKLDKKHDLVIFTVKTPDLEMAYQDNHPYLEDCLILTTQNGVQADNILCTHFEPTNMLSSIVMFGATYSQPGEVIFNFPGNWILGKPYCPLDVTTHDIAEMLGKAFDVTVSRNIMGMKWLKVFVNFNNCIPALMDMSMQETFADIDFCRLSILLLKEGLDIVKQANIKLDSLPNFPVDRIIGLSQMPVEQAAGITKEVLTGLSKEPLYGSILQSIKRNRPSEIDFINGEVSQVARSLLSDAPLNNKIVGLIHRIEETGRFLTPDDVKKEFKLNTIK
ncbi:MAG: 2-dehydropantoate 2-reductase [Candidatus Omnitrophica bacterium]|nr:2-dehydropantoate 2-reductase [Candidatus Omnitrophota bacterium]